MTREPLRRLRVMSNAAAETSVPETPWSRRATVRVWLMPRRPRPADSGKGWRGEARDNPAFAMEPGAVARRVHGARACRARGRRRGDGHGDRRPQRAAGQRRRDPCRSEEHTSELQSLMRISYAVFCLKKKTRQNKTLSTTL